MLSCGVSTTQAPSVFQAVLRFASNGQGAERKTPSQQTLSSWRQGLGTLALLQGAVTLALCVSYTLHDDLTTKNKLKLGCAVLRCEMPDGSFELVALGGVFTHANGTAKECVAQIIAAFDQAEVLLSTARAYLAKDEVDYQWIPEVEKGTLGRTQPMCSQSDHANAAKATNHLLHATSFSNLVYMVGCQDHVRTNIADAATKRSDILVKELLGEKEPQEFASEAEITSSFIREVYLEFFGNYEFGQNDGFKAFVDERAPTKYVRLLPVLGHRNDVYVENAGRLLSLIDLITAYLYDLKITKEGGLNQLEWKILKRCGNIQIRADLRAQSILWFTILQPYRILANSKELNVSYLGISPYVRTMEKVLGKAAVEGFEEIINTDVFGNAALMKKIQNYRDQNPEAWRLASQVDDLVPEELARDLQKAQARAALDKLHDLASELCEEGKYANPSEVMQKAMVSTLPVNRPAESLFGRYNYWMKFLQNASHFTLSTLTAVNTNHTIEWLLKFAVMVRDSLVRFGRWQGPKAAKADRKKLSDEAKQSEHDKAERRTHAADLARTRRVEAAVLDLRCGEFVKSAAALKISLQTVKTQCHDWECSEIQTTEAQLEFIKLQNKLWKRAGAPKVLIAVASYKDEDTEKRVDHTVKHMTEKLEELMVAVSTNPSILVPPQDPMAIFMRSLSFRGEEARGKLKALVEAEMGKLRETEEAIKLEAQLLHQQRLKKASDAGEKRKAKSRMRDESDGDISEEEDTEEEDTDEESSTSSEEASQEGNEGSEDEKTESTVEDPSGDEKKDDMIFSTWEEAMPDGGIRLDQPSGLTKKPLLNKKILLRGDHGWFRGHIRNVKRSGLVIIRYQIEIDGRRQQPLDMYQNLTMKSYGVDDIPGAWVLFK
jgi:hypothetical protein